MGELFGPNLLQQLLLALALALVVGNVWALLKPPPARRRPKGDLARAPLVRSVVMITVGSVVAVWTLATLIT